MQATQTTQEIRGMGLGRKLVAVVLVAVGLAYGSLASAAPGDRAESTGATGCGANAAPATLSTAPAIEWSSSQERVGQPY